MKAKRVSLLLDFSILLVISGSLIIFPLLAGSSVDFAKLITFSEPEIAYSDKPVFQKGVSYVAWSRDEYGSSDSDTSLTLLKETNTQWVAICFLWYQTNLGSHDIHADPRSTPSNESIKHAISKAHDLGYKVMLKPMVDPLEGEEASVNSLWRGEIKPSDEWFESYGDFINLFAEFAEQNNVEVLCVGCELKATTQETVQWEKIVSEVRKRYYGPITYAADWSNYKNIDWWDSLDYVGIDAYFPLSVFEYDPTIKDLKESWAVYASEVETWHLTVNKPIIFTEIGYRSGDGTNMLPANYWTEMSVDLAEQRDCYEAAFRVFYNKSWFYGFYWWNWETEPFAGGSDNAGYTPQNKPAENVLAKWYSKSDFAIVVDQASVSDRRCSVDKNQSVKFHASWEHNNDDVFGAKMFINGVEYVTNENGFVNLIASYDTVGKRVWVVTDVQHPEARCYKKIVEDPYVIWDKLDIEDVDVNTTALGRVKVVVKVVYAYDKTPVTGLDTVVNGVPCVELEPGAYGCEIFDWNPLQAIEIQTYHSGFSEVYMTMTVVHITNLTLYVTTSLVGALILFVLLKKIRFHSE